MEYLEVPTKDTRYAYVTGRVRGLEKHLLKEADFTRLKESEGLKQAVLILAKSYPYSESLKRISQAEDFEEGLEEELRRSRVELKSFSPQPELVNLFWLEYDFHNIKVLLKVKGQRELSKKVDESKWEKYLSKAGSIQIGLLQEAVYRENFLDLPGKFKDLISEIITSIKKEFHPLKIDTFLDKKFFEVLSLKLREYDDPFLDGLGKKLIDRFNIEAFLRMKLWGRETKRNFLEEIIAEGGGVEKKRLVDIAEQSENSLVEELKSTEYSYPLQKALEEWKNKRNLSRLDDFFDKNILKYTRVGLYITFGREPLINYIFLKKNELKRLRKILRGKYYVANSHNRR